MNNKGKFKKVDMPCGGQKEVLYGPSSGWDKNHAKRWSDEEIINALEECKGYVGNAAQLLGYSTTQIHRRINGSEEIQEAVKAIRERRLDWVENKFMRNVQDGSVQAQMFFLKTQGRSRGYEDKGDNDDKDKVIQALIEQIAVLKAKYYSGEENE